jgi:uncharacterized protein
MRSALHSLTVVLCSNCTLRCAYCYQRAGGSLVIRWPALRASLDVLLASSYRPVTVEFSGGEPLLAFRLIQRAVRYVAESPAGSRVEYLLTTNGTLLGPRVLAFLDRHGFEMRLSFHGDPGTRDPRGRETFRRLDRLLDWLRADHHTLWRERLGVAVTVGIRDLPTLADTVQYLVEKGVRNIGIAAAFGEMGWRVEDITEIERQFGRITRLVRRYRARTGTVPLSLYRKEGPDPRPSAAGDLRCSGAEGYAITVDPNGHAYGCVMLAGARAVAGHPHAAVGAPASRAGAALPPALVLDQNSPLWSLRLGDVRDAGFARRLGHYPSAVRCSGVFERRRAQRSSYARCGTCRFIGECSVCPVACAFSPNASDERRVSDFVCGFNRVSFTHRQRFPAEPTALERMNGRAPVPSLVRELQQYAGRLRR